MDAITKNELKNNLKNYCETHLQKPPRNGTECFYICPFCGSGTGKHKTPGFHIYPERMPTQYKCQSCGETGDIFRLVMELEHLEFYKALERVNELYGNPDAMRGRRTRTRTRGKSISRIVVPVRNQSEPPRTEPETPPDQWQTVMTNISRTAEERIFSEIGKDAREYLSSRGLDEQTIRDHHIGFLPLTTRAGWMARKGYFTRISSPIPADSVKNICIPAGITFPYIMDGKICKFETRRTPEQLTIMQTATEPDETGERPEPEKIGQVRGCRKALFNSQDAECRDKRRDIIFTEGVIDAMSINQAVGRWCNDEIKAVTFGSATTYGDPDEFFKWYVMPYRVAVGFDNDDAGRTNGEKFAEIINQARNQAGRSEAILIFPPEPFKDWNDFLVKDSRTVFSWITQYFPVDG